MKSIVVSGFCLAAAVCGPALAENNAGKKSEAAADHLSCTGEPNEIRVIIRSVKQSVGLMTIELYRNDPAVFLSQEGREVRQQFAARAPVTEICLHAPDATDYAIAVYHDKNANHRFDKGALGLPAEPYGVSNNPRMRLAPPTIEEALFSVAEDGARVEIELRN